MPASSRAVMAPSGNPLPSRRWPRSASAPSPGTALPARPRPPPAPSATPGTPWPSGTPPGKQRPVKGPAPSGNFHPSPVKYLLVARRNGSSPECGFGLAVPAASCNHLQPLECMGEIGEIYLFIVVICRQWVFLMRNICFCVFPENIIPL